jgi:hypothetical protein
MAFSVMITGMWLLLMQCPTVIVTVVAMDDGVIVRSIMDIFLDAGHVRVPRLGGVMRQASWLFVFRAS